jgi:cysteine synthase B
MAAAMRGYRMILIMPENQSVERCQTMRAFGAELILTPKAGGMEAARDLADQMARRQGHRARPVRQPGQPAGALRRHRAGDLARHEWSRHALRFQHGHHRHHHGLLALLQGKNPAIRIIGCQPEEGAQIPGIRKWPEAYLPKIYDGSRVDQVESVGQGQAEEMTRSAGARGGHLRRYFLGRRAGCRLAHRQPGRERGDRQHRLRPRRPLSVDRGLPGLNRRAARAGVNPAARSFRRC